MPVQVNVAEAKAKLSELLTRVEAGEEFVIARAGKPVARLAPPSEAGEKPKRHFGMWKHMFPPDWNPDDALDDDDPRYWGEQADTPEQYPCDGRLADRLA